MQFSFAQEKTVTGTVTDGKLPLPGANVVIKGTKGGVSTDIDGKFSIKAKSGDVLVVSFTSYDSKTITVGTANNYNVSLKETPKVLDEVLISGAMGIKRTKDEITSSQKTIGNKELNQAASPSVIQALTGKVSGLQINTTSNGVTAENRIVIRGNRSISGNNQALVVIDNAISSSSVLAQLPPDFIENVNVIKGAQGAALYGAQGVNGVILVTTKRGSKSQKISVNLSSSIDFQNVNFVADRQQLYGQGWASDDNMDASAAGIPAGNGWVVFENGSWGPAFNDPTMPAIVPVGLPQSNGTFITTNWAPIKDNIKKFFKTGNILQNSISLSAGGEDSYANLSLNRQSNDFVVSGDKMTRSTVLFKAGKRIGKFNIDSNINYIAQSSTQTDSGLYYDLLQTAVNIPVEKFGEMGGDNLNHWTPYATSPYWTSKNVRNNASSNIFNGILGLGYKLSDHVSFAYTGNLQLNTSESQSYQDNWHGFESTINLGDYSYAGLSTLTYSQLGNAQTSYYFANQSMYRNYYGDLLVNFKYDLTNDLKMKFNVGSNLQDSYSRVTSVGGTNLDRDGFFNIINVLNASKPKDLANSSSQRRIAAFFGNLDLNYKDYLFLNVTNRWEQSSVVPKSYVYPSVGLSFVPTKAIEGLKGGKVLNYAKLNASYTSVGNTSSIGTYAVNNLSTVHSGFNFGTLMSYAFNTSQVDKNIRPEYVNTAEFGGQLGFFNDRITLEASVYSAETKDLITNATTSSASGAARVLKNVGNLRNKGFEIDLGFVPVKTNNFRWDLKTNFAAYKTKVTSLQDGVSEVNLGTAGQVGIFAVVGEDFPLIKGTKFIRDDNGNIVVDGKGNPLKTSSFERLGKGAPDFIIGLTNSLEYKGLKLTVVADYRSGASTWSQAKQLLFFTGGDLETTGFDRTQGYVIPGSVTTTGAVNTIPVGNDPTYTGTLNYFTTNHQFVGESSVIDASAIKIRELALSYSLSKKTLGNSGITAATFGVNARNPFVFLADGKLLKPKNGLANNGYGDPEANYSNGNSQGIMNVGQYPTTRSIGFSVNISF